MQSGLPCFGVVNAGNDLVNVVRDHRVGRIVENRNIEETYTTFIAFVKNAMKILTFKIIVYVCLAKIMQHKANKTLEKLK